MTHLDDVELGQRLKALRVEPPYGADFESRLGERLLALEQTETTTPALGARIIIGPWLRRGPVRLIGATALLLAGAAAAMEGGVVEWVQARVFQNVDDGARPEQAPPEVASPSVHRAPAPRLERTPRPEAAPEPPAAIAETVPVPAVPLGTGPTSAAPVDLAHPFERRVLPRPGPEHTTLQPGREALARDRSAANEALRSARGADEPIRVPRVAIERRWSERSGSGERRFDGRRPQLEARDTQRPLEHLREVARQRRERGAGERGTGQRAPSLERLRERRERVIERRDGTGERREGERRERGGR